MRELELLDWKRQVFDIYRRVRECGDSRSAWAIWRHERDLLFGQHPQSPLPEEAKPSFQGLHYFEYDPSFRLAAGIEPAEEEVLELPISTGTSMTFRRLGRATFELQGEPATLDLYWLEGYGGGLFLPFGDATNGDVTYGAGRYLLDSAKGADLGMHRDRLVLDFNFSYNPSCSYDARWACPLAPPANRLAGAITAGERIAGA